MTPETTRPVRRPWLVQRWHDLAPIPGTKRVSRLVEIVAADALELSADQLARLAAIAPPAGDRYADMTPLGR